MPIVSSVRFVWSIGDGVVLIPRTVAIADAYHELCEANHDRNARWSPLKRLTPEENRAALERSGQRWLDGSRLPLAIARTTEDGYELVGAAGLNIDQAARAGEVGFWLDAAAEGKGLVTKALTAVLSYAFTDLGLHRVELRTLTDNERSRRLAERLGFTLEGTLRSAALFPDGPRDTVLYALLGSDFARRG